MQKIRVWNLAFKRTTLKQPPSKPGKEVVLWRWKENTLEINCLTLNYSIREGRLHIVLLISYWSLTAFKRTVPPGWNVRNNKHSYVIHDTCKSNVVQDKELCCWRNCVPISIPLTSDQIGESSRATRTSASEEFHQSVILLKLALFEIHGGDLHSQLQHHPPDILSLTFHPGEKTPNCCWWSNRFARRDRIVYTPQSTSFSLRVVQWCRMKEIQILSALLEHGVWT